MKTVKSPENPADPALLQPETEMPVPVPEPVLKELTASLVAPNAAKPTSAEFNAVDTWLDPKPNTIQISTDLPVIDIHELDWQTVGTAADALAFRARMHGVVQQMGAMSCDGVRFASNVSASDFAYFLTVHRAREWIGRAGKLAVRLIAQAPRALFMPDGLLVAHGGFPLANLHPRLVESGDWNDLARLLAFVWSRAHPKAQKKCRSGFRATVSLAMKILPTFAQ